MAPQREWFDHDYYKALGVPEEATEADIRRAYRKLAKQCHPDTHPGSEERFKEISSAYDVLSDAAKRKEYDEVRRLGPMAGGRGFAGADPFSNGGGGFGAGGGPGGGFRFTTENVGDLGDLFGGLFGRRRAGGGGAGPGAAGSRRGDDLEAQLHLAFLDSVNGATTTVHVTSDAACHTCNGTGAAPGTSATVCSRCGGRGVVNENQGIFAFSQACPQCMGRGMVVETPCSTCRGSGVERRPRQVKVRIPAGVDDGQRIRLKGRGAAGRDGGPPGDLYVVVRVAPHELFGRSGPNLTLDVPITFAEAALGAQVTVPTLLDGPVAIKVPPGTASGRTFRVRGRGLPLKESRGDLLVTVEVAVPSKLSASQRKALEALAAASTESPRAHFESLVGDRAESG